jgi:hypothetical protein
MKTKEKRGHIRERVLRVILNHPNGELTQYKIAKLVDGAFSWVHDTLKGLEKNGLIEGTKVRKYRELFLLWKDWKTDSEKREYMIRDPLELLAKTKLKYALTTYSGENLVQKYLFPSRTDFYIDPKDLEKWHKLLSENGLVGKGNVRVLIADKHVFYNSFVRNGLTVVSIPQLIVDLMTEGAVGGEAADMLLEKEKENAVSRL